MVHKESPPAKNSFLEDLDNLEVSGNTSAEQIMAYSVADVIRIMASSVAELR